MEKQTMQMQDYQDTATSLAIYPNQRELAGLVYTALGLSGESGEFADKIKKIVRAGVPMTDAEFWSQPDNAALRQALARL